MLSDPTVPQLLSLVKASLWQIPADIRPFTDSAADWDKIGRLAMLQTVGPLAVAGALSLPASLLPPKGWLRKGYAFTELNRRTHRLLDSCVAETFTTLTHAGLTPVLLKGQAYARAYPDPTLRQCGDIDIYVGPESYRQAYEAACRAGWESKDNFNPCAKHYGCSLRGVKIELHRVAGQLASHRAECRFTRWSADQLTAGLQTITIGDMSISVPTPLFDIVFVFLHLFHHFLNGGVGLRQVCDWVMLLHIHSRDIDRQQLKQLLHTFGLMKAWQLFAPITVNSLGLPPEECPFYSPHYSRKADMILSFIIREGNFGIGEQNKLRRPKGYITGKAYSFVHHSARLYSKFHIDPLTIMHQHLDFLCHGISRVISDMLSRD